MSFLDFRLDVFFFELFWKVIVGLYLRNFFVMIVLKISGKNLCSFVILCIDIIVGLKLFELKLKIFYIDII